jgi:hypothetical protein
MFPPSLCVALAALLPLITANSVTIVNSIYTGFSGDDRLQINGKGDWASQFQMQVDDDGYFKDDTSFRVKTIIDGVEKQPMVGGVSR